jgi:hypothetical protein
MEFIKIWLDDVNQIYFTGLENLRYELFQADKRFGFNDIDVTNLTTSDTDGLLIAKSSSSEKGTSQNVSNTLKNQFDIPKLKIIREEKNNGLWAFGFEGFAIIPDEENVWLLIRSGDELIYETMASVITQLSIQFDLFLVDSQQGIVVDSKSKSNIVDYLNN